MLNITREMQNKTAMNTTARQLELEDKTNT